MKGPNKFGARLKGRPIKAESGGPNHAGLHVSNRLPSLLFRHLQLSGWRWFVFEIVLCLKAQARERGLVDAVSVTLRAFRPTQRDKR